MKTKRKSKEWKLKISINTKIAMKTEKVQKIMSDINSKHRMSGTRTYITWIQMRQRCNNPNANNYKYYGKRGIKVCDEWNNKKDGFQNFYKDMGERPEGMSLDRKDNDGNYILSNCRWATPSQQVFNRRKFKKYDK